MNLNALLFSIGLCVISVLFEVLGTSKKGKVWFERLKLPKFSFPFWIWYIVGGIYYIICGVIAYRIFLQRSNPLFITSFILLASMMFLNGLTNYFLFKMRSLKAFYFAIYPFSIVTISLFIILLTVDKQSAWVLFPYVLWLIYDIYYFHFIWKLNEQDTSGLG